MIQKGKTMIQNSRLEDKESLLNRDFIEKRKEDFLLTPFLVFVQIYFSAALAVTTKDANAAESFIAISAKIFLSNSIADNFNPFMNLE